MLKRFEDADLLKVVAWGLAQACPLKRQRQKTVKRLQAGTLLQVGPPQELERLPDWKQQPEGRPLQVDPLQEPQKPP